MNKLKKMIVSLCWFLNSQRTSKYIINMVLCILILVLFETIGKSVTDDVISFFLGFLMSNLVIGMIQVLFRSVEDNAKVTDDTDQLVRIYRNDDIERGIWLGEDTAAKFAYKPLFCNDGSPIIVEDNGGKTFEPDGFISDNYQTLFAAHRMSKKENFVTVRLDDFKYENGEAKFYLSRSNYYYHLVTNRAIDYRIDDELSLRTYYDNGPSLCPLRESFMSNHIGINALVFLKDGELLLPRRSGSSTISKNLITSSIAIMLTMPTDNKITASYLFKDCIYEGLISRTKMRHEWINENEIDIEFLGFGQNPYEGGKPQFYYAVKMKNIDKEMYIKELCRLQKESKKNKKRRAQSNEQIKREDIKPSNLSLNYTVPKEKITTVYSENSHRGVESVFSELKNKKAIDPDKYIYVVETEKMRFNKEGYLVIEHNHGFIKDGNSHIKPGKAVVGYEKSFLANLWHYKLSQKSKTE